MSEKQSLRIRVTDLEVENKQLREALSKCSERLVFCYDCGCELWNEKGIRHAEDCEYMRLTGG